MPWYGWALVIYYAVDRLYTVSQVGTTVEITPGFAVAALFTGALWTWAVLALGGVL